MVELGGLSPLNRDGEHRYCSCEESGEERF
jgi:hypothetical protein